MIAKLWAAAREWAARLFRRKPVEPGRFVADSKLAWRGWLAVMPWLWPSREYLVYVPRAYGGWRRRPLLVLLHGCRQTPEDFAAATRIAALADSNGWLVLLPRQSSKANAWTCWNWFDKATSAGRGEAAIVVAQIRAVRRAYRVHPRRIFVAGMSAGGCLAAVLGLRHPKLFAGVAAHSAVACGAASGPMAAMQVLAHGADTAVEQIGAAARDAASRRALPVPLLVVHGGDDHVVSLRNARQLVRQYLVFNGRLDPKEMAPDELPPPDREITQQLSPGRTATTIEYRDGARTLVRMVRVDGLGHAWSGGDATFPYNDPLPPDATALLGAFVADQIR
ncbi:MAG TPA: PHB depolymerase family esterase [Casimicrobiaceae bacterium]|jgi:poly(3-hydroxybutyrate) depolymerase|nr:PHB depolymerase family esterase [Casimicrobiaceae bacterium]